MTDAQKLKIGEYVILKGQRKGRYHLEGGVLIALTDDDALIMCDQSLQIAMRANVLEPLSKEYVTTHGNDIVAPLGNWTTLQ